jgi:hypothetical protein
MRAVSRALSWARLSRRARIAARAMAVQASCDQGTCDPCQRSKDARPLKVVRVNAGVTQRLLRSSSALSTTRAGGRGPCAAIEPQATQQEDLLTTRAKAMPFSTSHRKGRASSQRAGQLHHRVHRKRLHPGLSCSALGCAGLGRNGVGHEGSNLTFASFSRSHAPFVVPQGEWNRECLLRAVVGQLITVFTTHHHKGGTWDGRARSPSDQLLPPLGRRRGPDNTSRSYASADRAPLGFLSSWLLARSDRRRARERCHRAGRDVEVVDEIKRHHGLPQPVLFPNSRKGRRGRIRCSLGSLPKLRYRPRGPNQRALRRSAYRPTHEGCGEVRRPGKRQVQGSMRQQGRDENVTKGDRSAGAQAPMRLDGVGNPKRACYVHPRSMTSRSRLGVACRSCEARPQIHRRRNAHVRSRDSHMAVPHSTTRDVDLDSHSTQGSLESLRLPSSVIPKLVSTPQVRKSSQWRKLVHANRPKSRPMRPGFHSPQAGRFHSTRPQNLYERPLPPDGHPRSQPPHKGAVASIAIHHNPQGAEGKSERALVQTEDVLKSVSTVVRA